MEHNFKSWGHNLQDIEVLVEGKPYIHGSSKKLRMNRMPDSLTLPDNRFEWYLRHGLRRDIKRVIRNGKCLVRGMRDGCL